MSTVTTSVMASKVIAPITMKSTTPTFAIAASKILTFFTLTIVLTSTLASISIQ